VAAANFAVYKYESNNPVASPGVPAPMAGASGTWRLLGFRTVGAGLANPTNAWEAGTNYDPLVQDPDNNDAAYKVKWLSGGRIQVLTGGAVWDGFAGGSQMHGAEGTAATGREFWIHTTGSTNSSWCGKSDGSPYNVMIFCPSAG